MRKTLTLILATATLGAGGIAYAQADRPERGADMTRAEAQEHAASMFARMDVNDDGQVDAADREAGQRERFARVDTDQNGSISYDEFTAMHEKRGEHREARAEGGEWQGKGRRGHHGMRGDGGRHMMGNADANSDGTITQAEFSAAALTRFDDADADNDGTVTGEERRAKWQEHRQERREQRQSGQDS